MRSRFHLFVLLAALVGWGCQTPSAYESAPLPRFLVDPAPALLPEPDEPPAVPVAERPAVTLPDAVRECVLNSLRLKVGEERVRLVQADYVNESLIPNCQLLADAQLLPLSAISFVNQAGPPQYDAYLTVPVDWLLFGKRVAARAAARLNVDVAQAELADLLRREIALTVDAFYDALEADVAVGLAEHTVQALGLEKLAQERAKGGKGSDIESRRVRLAVLDAQRDANGGPRLRPLRLNCRRIGRPPDTPTSSFGNACGPGVAPRSAWHGRGRSPSRTDRTWSLLGGRLWLPTPWSSASDGEPIRRSLCRRGRLPRPDADHRLPQCLALDRDGATTLPSPTATRDGSWPPSQRVVPGQRSEWRLPTPGPMSSRPSPSTPRQSTA